MGSGRLFGELPLLRRYDTAVFANVFGQSTDDYLRVVEVLNRAEGLAGYEINISCPNVKKGGIVYGSDPAATHEVVKAIKQVASRPVIVKLSPNVTVSSSCQGGRDAVSFPVNNQYSARVCRSRRNARPRLGHRPAGFRGPRSSGGPPMVIRGSRGPYFRDRDWRHRTAEST